MKLPHFYDQLPDAIKVRMGQKRSGRQRAMAAGDHLLLILHKPPEPGRRARDPAYFWRKPEGSWESGRGGGLRKVEEHLEEYERAEASLSGEYEAATNAASYFQLLERAAPLWHSARGLHHALQSAREAVPLDRDIIDLRDRADEIERTLELLHADATNALRFHLAQQAEHHAVLQDRSIQIANRLNLLAAVFFPLMALSGLFSMNLASGLEDGSTASFWFVLVIGVVLGFALSSWVLRGTQERP